ncbi:MAG: methylmalonyl Co-A mutase-associated GTPase MeaB [Actinobacteria bacterium]|nr:methylmalonyl Co-A mutase-associated GTPase MeaB [Actinomycetota bacterium]
MSALPADPVALAELVRAGDRRAVARAISRIEDEDPIAEGLVAALWPHVGRARVVGVTGPPGVGKSTLVGALAAELRRRGQTVGVVAVDPSSPFTQGAVLGDRVRLVEHDTDDGVFFRSMGSRGRLGGVAEATALAVAVLDCAGFDVVLVETVGAGQSDIRVADLVDVVVLALQPGSGDSVQAIKAGVMEIPDVVALTKSDLPGVDAFRSELRLALGIDPERAPLLAEVSVPNGTGVAEVLDAAERVRAGLGDDGVRARRRAGRLNEAVQTAAARAAARADRVLRSDPEVVAAAERLDRGELDPLALVRLIEARSGEAP